MMSFCNILACVM